MGFLHHYPDIPDRIVGGLFLLAQSLSVTTTESCAGELTLDSILRLIFRCFRSIRHFPHRLMNRGILLLTFAWKGSGISVSGVVLAVLLLPPALSGRYHKRAVHPVRRMGSVRIDVGGTVADPRD